MDPRTAQRVYTELDLGVSNYIQIDYLPQILDVFGDVIMLMGRRAVQRLLQGNALDAVQLVLQKLIRPGLNQCGGLAVRRAAIRRVVFESAVFGGVMGGSHNDAVRQPGRSSAVISQDGVRNGRSWRVIGLGCDH